jgi:hypothetical protein
MTFSTPACRAAAENRGSEDVGPYRHSAVEIRLIVHRYMSTP